MSGYSSHSRGLKGRIFWNQCHRVGWQGCAPRSNHGIPVFLKLKSLHHQQYYRSNTSAWSQISLLNTLQQVLCSFRNGVPVKFKKKLTTIKNISGDRLSLVSTPSRIYWTILFNPKSKLLVGSCRKSSEFQAVFGRWLWTTTGIRLGPSNGAVCNTQIYTSTKCAIAVFTSNYLKMTSGNNVS
jgi:hypothetical protein